VSTDLLTLATACMLGFLHALEVDHMLAVTAFVSTRPALRVAARFGLRWGLGHSIAVFAVGGTLLLTGFRWPAGFNAVAEAAVGVMLVGLGFWALRSSRRLHLHPPGEHGDHLHLHVHDGAAHSPGGPHLHDHPRHAPAMAHHDHPGHGHAGLRPADPALQAAVPPAPHAHGHDHGVTVVGLMHGLSGTAAVVALVPITMIHRTALGLGYLAAFGVGVTVAMTIYAGVAAVAIRQAADRSVVWGRRISALVGVAGIAVGSWWLWSALRG
jgi:hypothetical protein